MLSTTRLRVLGILLFICQETSLRMWNVLACAGCIDPQTHFVSLQQYMPRIPPCQDNREINETISYQITRVNRLTIREREKESLHLDKAKKEPRTSERTRFRLRYLPYQVYTLTRLSLIYFIKRAFGKIISKFDVQPIIHLISRKWRKEFYNILCVY